MAKLRDMCALFVCDQSNMRDDERLGCINLSSYDRTGTVYYMNPLASTLSLALTAARRVGRRTPGARIVARGEGSPAREAWSVSEDGARA